MGFELLSGPDLGAGFLFQLTVDRSGARPRVTVHAQEGGRDANGPPRGSPMPFGFVRAPPGCPIGGSECYHQTVELEEAELPRARMAYNRLRFVLAPMLEQQYGGEPIPIDAALEEVVRRLGERFDATLARWYLGGSAAAFVQGAAVTPHDIDLGTDREGVAGIAAALNDYLIEPVGERVGTDGRHRWGARAYVGSLRSGVRVEWAVDTDPLSVSDPLSEWGPDPASVPTVRLDRSGRPFRATRLEFFVLASAAKRRPESVAAGLRALRGVGVDRALFDRLLAGSPLAPGERDALARRLDE